MKADEEIESGSRDNLALSFLDVLSCGLGAAIYLFLIFSVLPHTGEAGATRLQGEGGLDARSRRGGVRLEDFDDVVRAATIQIEIRFQEPLAITAVPRWQGLRKALAFTERDAAGRVLSFSALTDHGVDPGQEIAFLFPAEALSQQIQAHVQVYVGGFSPGPQPILLRASAPILPDGFVRVFDISFGRSAWISAPGLEAAP